MTKSDRLLAAFTPSIMSHATLEAIFVRREALAVRLMENIVSSTHTRSKRHSLLIGPRGIGKTHLVSLLYHRVKEDPALSESLRIAWLREETWEVTSFLDLLESIVAALAAEYQDEVLSAGLAGLKSLPVESAEVRVERLLLDFLGDRVLLLIVENLADVFEALEEIGQRQLRAFLQNHANTILLATTPSLFHGVSDHDSPFFGFFNAIHLDELTLDDAVLLLEKIAVFREDPELAAFLKTDTGHDRLKAVQHLAGGHPRIWIFFAGIITQETLDALVPAFLEMLDDLTPYYQSRMKELPAQQRKIISYLCQRRGSAPVKEIADACRLSQQAAGAQLHSLREKAFVRSETAGRESWYELNEPLLRLVLEVKESRGRPIRLIVDFLRRWYSRSERRAKYAKIPAEACMTRQYIESALDLRGFSDAEPRKRKLPPQESDVDVLSNSEDPEVALLAAEQAIEDAGNEVTSNHWTEHGKCLYDMERYAEALESYDRAIELNSDDLYAYNCQGYILTKMRRYTEAVKSYDRAIILSPNNAQAHHYRGEALHNMGCYIEALECFDKAIDLKYNNVNVHGNRGITLYKMGRFIEALESFDKVIKLNPNDSLVYFWRGGTLEDMGCYAEALESYEKAIELDPNYAVYYNRGCALENMERYTEALKSYEKAIELNPNVADTYNSCAQLLLVLDRWLDFLISLGRGFEASEQSKWRGFPRAYCQLILVNSAPSIWPERIASLVGLYHKYEALKWLGQGLTESISALFEAERSVEAAEAWNAAWQATGKGYADLEIPLRLLDAAVRWRRKPDRRILLGLPVEERSVLETLLPLQT